MAPLSHRQAPAALSGWRPASLFLLAPQSQRPMSVQCSGDFSGSEMKHQDVLTMQNKNNTINYRGGTSPMACTFSQLQTSECYPWDHLKQLVYARSGISASCRVTAEETLPVQTAETFKQLICDSLCHFFFCYFCNIHKHTSAFSFFIIYIYIKALNVYNLSFFFYSYFHDAF